MRKFMCFTLLAGAAGAFALAQDPASPDAPTGGPTLAPAPDPLSTPTQPEPPPPVAPETVAPMMRGPSPVYGPGAGADYGAVPPPVPTSPALPPSVVSPSMSPVGPVTPPARTYAVPSDQSLPPEVYESAPAYGTVEPPAELPYVMQSGPFHPHAGASAPMGVEMDCVCTPRMPMQGGSFSHPGYGGGWYGTTVGHFGSDNGGYNYTGAPAAGVHVRHPYFSYRAPWYTPGPPSQNVTIVW